MPPSESVKAVVTVLNERKRLYRGATQPKFPEFISSPQSVMGSVRQISQRPRRRKSPRKSPCRSGSSPKARQLYPIESCSEVHYHVPESCQHCGEQLKGKDEQPYRHQIIEIPPLSAYVIEHQLHQERVRVLWQKDACPTSSRGAIDRVGRPISGSGRGLLSGEHHQSHRMVKSLLATLFGVELSRGSINRLRHQVRDAIAVPVEQAHQYVQAQRFVHSDETGFSQGNGDGLNPTRTKGWLWVLVTPLVKVFSVVLSRSQATAKTLIGEA